MQHLDQLLYGFVISLPADIIHGADTIIDDITVVSHKMTRIAKKEAGGYRSLGKKGSTAFVAK